MTMSARINEAKTWLKVMNKRPPESFRHASVIERRHFRQSPCYEIRTEFFYGCDPNKAFEPVSIKLAEPG